MISKEEMKNYFLKANYQALRSEFRHDFHEITYFKPTFCNYCNGFVRLCLSFIKFIKMPLITIKNKKALGPYQAGLEVQRLRNKCASRLQGPHRSRMPFQEELLDTAADVELV